MIDLDLVLAKLDKVKYAEQLRTDVGAHQKRVNSAIKILTGLTCSFNMEDSEAADMVKTMEGLVAQQANVLEWAEKFGVSTGASKKRKRN